MKNPKMQPPQMDAVPMIIAGPVPKRQARLRSKMDKLTNGGTSTPTGKNMKKYNKAATKNRKMDDDRSSKLGYGTVTQQIEANKINVRYPTGLHSILKTNPQFYAGKKGKK
jgi:hypothetical protein